MCVVIVNKPFILNNVMYIMNLEKGPGGGGGETSHNY